MLTDIRVPNVAGAGPGLSLGRWFKRAGELEEVVWNQWCEEYLVKDDRM